MANILVVEDDEQVRVLAVSIVEELGHTAQSAANMDEALALLATDQVFELLFTDLGLSGHDQAGLVLAVEAVRQREKLPVLYTTGQAFTDGMKALLVDNASLLPKPYTFDQLAAALKEVLKIKLCKS
jgi:two-component system, cell cycle sensor histidine kinase and response regulator CckA